NMPVRAIDALRNESSSGAYPAVGGRYGASISRLRAALLQLSEISPNIATELRTLGDDMDSLRLSIQRGSIANDIADVKFMSTVSDQLAACAGTFGESLTNPFRTFASCANAAA